MRARRSRLIVMLSAVAGLWFVVCAAREQGRASDGAGSEAEQALTIRVGVEEVRIDAVVVDRKERQITDLTKEDFEIYQDGRRQELLSSTYIGIGHPSPTESVPERSKAPGTPVSSAPLARAAVRRTILFLVDDASMGFQDLHFARMALRKFIETQMEPGDLVGILPTKGGDAGLRPFSSNQRALLATVDEMHWSNLRETPVIPIGMGILHGIRALQSMPGRKFLILLSTNVMLPPLVSEDESYNGIADQALRAGVVIHTMDMVGLAHTATRGDISEGPGGFISINPVLLSAESRGPEDQAGRMFDKMFGKTAGEIVYAQKRARSENRQIPFSKKTGGMFLSGSNFFVNGIGDVEEQMKGYYLLSYIPEARGVDDEKPTYHRLKIRVRRSGAEVRTRDGFYGRPASWGRPGESPDPMMESLYSPFLQNGLKLRLASEYIDDPESGALLKTWLHVDGNGVGVATDNEGRRFISLEAVAATSGVSGAIQDSGTTRIKLPVNEREIEWIKENGISFSLSVPAKQPGAYYVRVAVKDESSGAIGAAYRFVEAPDLKKSELALSGIFLVNADETESEGQANRSKKAARMSQAFRTYLPGESFEYMAVIYAGNRKAGDAPELESSYVLFRNGLEIFRSKPQPINAADLQDPNRIALRNRLELDGDAEPGEYVLKLIVEDKRMKEKRLMAAQTLDFVVARQPGSQNKGGLE